MSSLSVETWHGFFWDQENQGLPQFPNMMGSRAEMSPLGAGTVGVCDLSLSRLPLMGDRVKLGLLGATVSLFPTQHT